MGEARIEVRDAKGLGARELVERGVELCREGNWKEGVAHLAAVAGTDQREIELPSYYYGYLGYGVVRTQRRVKEGVALCKKAVKLGYADVENHLNLARTYWFLKKRRAAVDALETGLRIDPRHAGLRALREEMGFRRTPVIPFLSRDNLLNRILGRRRHERDIGLID